MTDKTNLTKKEKVKDYGTRIFNSTPPQLEVQAKLNEQLKEMESLKQELAKLKDENFNIKTISALEKAGCLKPELVLKAIPKDCESLQDWIESFKTENDILFKQPPQNHGGNFKPSNCSNLSPTELMNNYIRGI